MEAPPVPRTPLCCIFPGPRGPIMAPISPNDELFTERMYHIKAIWMRNHPYVLRVLLEEGINTWYDFMDFTVNLDENTINS
eukprot:2960499-Prorocentrum_lima.AAC.1